MGQKGKVKLSFIFLYLQSVSIHGVSNCQVLIPAIKSKYQLIEFV